MPDINLGFAAMVIVLVATAIWSYRAFKVNLPDNLAPFAIAWGAGSIMGAIALVQGTDSRGAAITAVALGGLLLFLLAAGKQKSAPGAISVGDSLPEFSAPDENGEIFHSSTLLGDAVVLKVFRGHW